MQTPPRQFVVNEKKTNFIVSSTIDGYPRAPFFYCVTTTSICEPGSPRCPYTPLQKNYHIRRRPLIQLLWVTFGHFPRQPGVSANPNPGCVPSENLGPWSNLICFNKYSGQKMVIEVFFLLPMTSEEPDPCLMQGVVTVL